MVTILTSNTQWCLAPFVLCLDVRLLINQELYDIEMTIPTGNV